MEINTPLHILFASRLVEEKGVDILLECIEATLQYEASSKNICWHICGKGPYEEEVFEIQKAYPENVIYHGLLSQAGLATLYRQADILFMPSRFLETFGLTALEAIASGTAVIGFRKGGLTAFIPKDLALDPINPIESFFSILARFQSAKKNLPSLTPYQYDRYKESIRKIFPKDAPVGIIHDYKEVIGGAEIYVDSLQMTLEDLSYRYSRYSYPGETTVWKRRLLFIFSSFAFWRYFDVKRTFSGKGKFQAFWLHSILRYTGIWGLKAILSIRKKQNAHLFLSHHDLGLLVAYPQDITSEDQIPKDRSLRAFLEHVPLEKRLAALIKWIYIQILVRKLPRTTTHILFSPFMEKHIKNHFPKHTYQILPHFYDEELFHP